MLEAPASWSLVTALRMSQGAMNWPFLTLTGLPVFPAATSKSVWREKGGDLQDIDHFGGGPGLMAFVDIRGDGKSGAAFDRVEGLETVT